MSKLELIKAELATLNEQEKAIKARKQQLIEAIDIVDEILAETDKENMETRELEQETFCTFTTRALNKEATVSDAKEYADLRGYELPEILTNEPEAEEETLKAVP